MKSKTTQLLIVGTKEECRHSFYSLKQSSSLLNLLVQFHFPLDHLVLKLASYLPWRPDEPRASYQHFPKSQLSVTD